MKEKDYQGFLDILYDYGGYNPYSVFYAYRGPEYEFRKKKHKRLEEYERKFGSPEHLLEKNKKDWDEHYEFIHTSCN